MPLINNYVGDATPSGEKLMAQYWQMYLSFFNRSEADMPPDQLREVKLALFTGMGFMAECIATGELRRCMELNNDTVNTDNTDYFGRCLTGIFDELIAFMRDEVPGLTLRAQIHLNAQP